MKVKHIPSHWLREDGRRFDCGPYMSGAREAKEKLARLSVRKDRLQQLTAGGMDGIINAGRIKRQWVDDPAYGVPFLSSSDILQADLSNLSLISNRVVSENPRLLIQPGWILVTRSGTIGRMVYARKDMEGMACSEDVMRILPSPGTIPGGYLYAFLSGKYGLPLITSGTYGAIIQHLEPHHIADLPVPRLGDDLEARVHALIEQAANLLTGFRMSLNTATTLFFESVGLQDLIPGEWQAMGQDLGFSQTFPCADSFRALNFAPRFKKICARITSGEWQPLRDICLPGTLKRGGRYKRIDADPEHSYQLIGQKQLFWLRPEGRWIARGTVGDDILVESGSILVAAQGTLGESELYCRAEFICGPDTLKAYSEHLLRVIANEDIMLRGCLFAFLRSETAFRMFRSISVGTKLQDHHHVFRGELPIPCPDRKTQAEIDRMVTNGYGSRHLALTLEDEAIRLVEQAIEEAA